MRWHSRQTLSPAGPTASLALPILLLAVVAWLAAIDIRPPPVADVGDSGFSADRAWQTLTGLLGEGQAPHVTGSEAQDAFHARLLDRLAADGHDPVVQDATLCSRSRPLCGRVRNVLTRIDGEGDGGAILLMAHYDSVPAAPGAGDNGAAVATLIEIARHLRAAGPTRNSVIILFTDAEERGHFGAEAFFSAHPWADEVDAVINMDGAGSTGGVYVLRIAPDSGHLLRAFRDSAAFPIARSIRQALFERIGSGSDFAVAIRAGRAGIDFSFTGERIHNHSPLDTLERLDIRTIQHHGENVLPLMGALADLDLTARAPNPVYYVVGQRHWLMWSPATGVALAAAALALLLFAVWRARTAATIPGIVTGMVVAALLVVASVILTYALFSLADRVTARTVAWPAQSWPWQVLFLVTPWLLLSLVAPLLARRCGPWSLLLGIWLAWAVLTLVIAIREPMAGSLLLPPLVVAAVLAALVAGLGGGRSAAAARLVALAAFVVAGYFLCTLVLENAIVAGLSRSSYLALAWGLLVALLLPLPGATWRGGGNHLVGLAAVAALIAGLVALPFVTVTSAEAPRWINITYVEGEHRGATGMDPARVIIHAGPPIPSWVAASAEGAADTAPALPWQPGLEAPTGPAPASGVDAPQVSVLASRETAEGRALTLLLESARHADHVDLWIEDPARLAAITIAGQAVPVTTGRPFQRIGFFAPPADGVVVELRLVGATPVRAFVADIRYGLPPLLADLERQRAPAALPYDNGDQWIIYRELQL